MLLTSTCLHPQCRALVVFKVLQLLEQTQSLLQGDGKHELQTHSGVLGPITHHKEERESSKDLESSPLFIAATCGKTFRDELMNFCQMAAYFSFIPESWNARCNFFFKRFCLYKDNKNKTSSRIWYAIPAMPVLIWNFISCLFPHHCYHGWRYHLGYVFKKLSAPVLLGKHFNIKWTDDLILLHHTSSLIVLIV